MIDAPPTPCPDSTPTPVEGGWPTLARRARDLADAVGARAVFYRRSWFDPLTANDCVECAANLGVLAEPIDALVERPLDDGSDLIKRWRELSLEAGALIRPNRY